MADPAKTGMKEHLREHVRCGALLLLLYVSVFREPAERSGILLIGMAAELLSVLGIFFLVYLAVREKAWRRLLLAGAACLVLYVLAGLAGSFITGFQPFFVTFQGLKPAVSFWLCLCVFAWLFRGFPLTRYGKVLSVHVSLLSIIILGCTAADMIFQIWDRQAHRSGIGSIQIFYGHPSVYAANTAFLLLLLLMLIPYAKLPRFIAPLMLFPLFMSLRIRIWGFAAAAALLALWIGVLGKKLRPIPVLASLGALLAIGWDRFYWYYFSPYARGLARGQFAYNSIRIAKDYFPLGTGFGTFGSRAAQIWYSPVYYWYDMYRTNGMDPLWPAYACDTFWPMILGESGVIGLLAYAGLVIVLFIAVLRLQKKGAWIFTAALTAFLYELIETTGALAFSDPAAVHFALLLGLAFGIAKEEAA